MVDDTHPFHRFTNVEAVLPEHVVATPGDSRTDPRAFHRLNVETTESILPACRVEEADKWQLARTDGLLEREFWPCVNCWQPILEFAAVDEESPVGLVDAEISLPDGAGGNSDSRRRAYADGAGAVFQTPPRARLPLDSLPEEVLLASRGGHDVFHAPTRTDDGDHEPICGEAVGEYRLKDRIPLRGTRRPCEAGCFTERVIEEWDPEDEWE